jgi:hypothetical protein
LTISAIFKAIGALTIAGTVWYFYNKAKDGSTEIRDEVKPLQPYQDDAKIKDSAIQSESKVDSLANKSSTELTNKTVIEVPHEPKLDPPGTVTTKNESITVDDKKEYIFL